MGQCLRHNHYMDPLWNGFYQAQLENLRWLIIFINRGNVKVVREFIRERNISEKSYRDYPPDIISDVAPVEHACRTGKIDMLKALLDIGFSPMGLSNRSPINIACECNHREVVRTLVETFHVSVRKADKRGNTPLSSAVEGNAFHVLLYLLDKQLELKSLSKNVNVIHEVARKGYTPMCQYLLNAGFQVNRRDSNGDTALKLAAINLHQDMCGLLLKAGAHMESLSMFDITKSYIRKNVRKPAGPRFKDYAETINILITHGLDPNLQDSEGNTSIHLLIHTDILAVTFLVCYINVSLHVRNSRHETPFMLALKSHRLSAVVKLLLRAGFTPGSTERSYISIDCPLRISKEGRRTLKYIEGVITNPRTLQELCIFKLRQTLGAKLSTSVSYLGLPSRLQDIIMLRHAIPDSMKESLDTIGRLQ